MTIKTCGTPNYQRFGETMMALLAAREGVEIEPGSVKVEQRKKGVDGEDVNQ